MIGAPRRAIGVWGTVARAGLGAALVGSVLYGHAARGWHPLAWLLGLLLFPAVVSAVLWVRARRDPAPLRATGPVANATNLVVFLVLYLTWWYAPAVGVLSDAALLFYGGSMLVAAARGYAGCEVLAVSNWLLHRDDRIGCALFWPIDIVEARRRSGAVEIELLLAPDCPNAAAARATLAACLRGLDVQVPVRERVGDYPSPTIMVDGVDVMTGRRGVASMHACRLDVPSADRLFAMLEARAPSAYTDPGDRS